MAKSRYFRDGKPATHDAYLSACRDPSTHGVSCEAEEHVFTSSGMLREYFERSELFGERFRQNHDLWQQFDTVRTSNDDESRSLVERIHASFDDIESAFDALAERHKDTDRTALAQALLSPHGGSAAFYTEAGFVGRFGTERGIFHVSQPQIVARYKIACPPYESTPAPSYRFQVRSSPSTMVPISPGLAGPLRQREHMFIQPQIYRRMGSMTEPRHGVSGNEPRDRLGAPVVTDSCG